MAMGFYLHHSGLWCIHQFWISYLSSSDLKNFLAIKDINKSLLDAKFQTNCLETVKNRSDSKSISDSGVVWCNER